jgi:hypothetical protein
LRCIGDATVSVPKWFPSLFSRAPLAENVPVQVTFRPLVDADLPMLHGWLNEPGVVRWWEDDDVSWDGVVRDYGSGHVVFGLHSAWTQAAAAPLAANVASCRALEKAGYRFVAVVEDRFGPARLMVVDRPN